MRIDMAYLLRDLLSMDWAKEANCKGVDPDLYFPSRESMGRGVYDQARVSVANVQSLMTVLTTP